MVSDKIRANALAEAASLMNLIRGPNDAVRWATYGFAHPGPRRHKAAKPSGIPTP